MQRIAWTAAMAAIVLAAQGIAVDFSAVQGGEKDATATIQAAMDAVAKAGGGTVDVPAGVDTGSRLRVSGEGEPGLNGGPRGDLYLAIEVERHDFFQRDGVNLFLDVPVTITQATLGDTVRVPTLDGEAELRIPSGTQPGTQLRMRGLGLPDLRGYRQGDLIVRIQVEIPQKITKRQRELLEEFQQLSDQKTYPLYRRFLDSLRRGAPEE